jgi:hypothetical protein
MGTWLARQAEGAAGHDGPPRTRRSGGRLPDIRRTAGHGADPRSERFSADGRAVLSCAARIGYVTESKSNKGLLFMRCSELPCVTRYSGGSYCFTRRRPGRHGSMPRDRHRDRAGRRRRHVPGRRSVGDAHDIHEHSPGYLPDTGGACGGGAGSRLCVTHPMDTSRGAKPGRPGIPGPGLPRLHARARARRSFSPRRSPSPSGSCGPRRSSSPGVAPGFRPRISVPHSTRPPSPGAGNVAAGTYCCSWP